VDLKLLVRLPLVGGGEFPGGGIFNRNYGEFSTGVDIPLKKSIAKRFTAMCWSLPNISDTE
jgi:hypothetical protein